jgi:hypothetical protein
MSSILIEGSSIFVLSLGFCVFYHLTPHKRRGSAGWLKKRGCFSVCEFAPLEILRYDVFSGEVWGV